MTRLRFERLQRHMTQHDVARRARVAQPVISLIERGRLIPTDDQIARLASVFRIHPPEAILEQVNVLTPVEPPQEVAQ